MVPSLTPQSSPTFSSSPSEDMITDAAGLPICIISPADKTRTFYDYNTTNQIVCKIVDTYKSVNKNTSKDRDDIEGVVERVIYRINNLTVTRERSLFA
jgi:hypothetical protein